MARSRDVTAADFIPEPPTGGRLTLPLLAEAAQQCRGCDLCCAGATQTVFGEGPASARLILVGEKPGDQEDRQGRPFVGPAGGLLDRVLEQIDLPRDQVYVTNAVKHFKFTMRGKRRLHQKPTITQVRSCLPWLEQEFAVIAPPMTIALGATAAQAMFGRDFRVTRHRGKVFESRWAPWSMATVHPSSLLRLPDEKNKAAAIEQFTDDLGKAADHWRQLG